MYHESLRYGEQADEWLSMYESYSMTSVMPSSSTPGLCVHLHLLKPEVGAVLEEG